MGLPVNNLNIIVVICHDLGQHLGCYGQPDVRSEHIDRFAAEGLRFANSFCTAPQCSPSRAALWTGRFPHANGVIGLVHHGFDNALHPSERHFAQILRDAGYETRLFGTQHEAKDPERCGYEFVHRAPGCSKLAENFETYLQNRPSTDAPLFAQIGFFEPHRPFPRQPDIELLPEGDLRVPPYLPDIPEVREDLSAIEASIATMDRAFGRVLAAIRNSTIADRTLLVFTADHGIAFPRAKMTLYDPGIQVPLIFGGVGVQAGSVCNALISNVDVMPTLLERADLPVPRNLHGRSFSGLLSGRPYIENEHVYAEKTYHTYYDPMRAVRDRRWKLIANFEFAPWQEMPPDMFCNAKGYPEVSRALDGPDFISYHPPFELYNLEHDPAERNNLADDPDRVDERNRLALALREWMERTGDPLLEGPMAQGAYRQRMHAFKALCGHAE